MRLKARYLTVGILLIALLFAAFELPSHAQNTGEPAAAEDPCTAIIEAGMQPPDETETVATEDPALESCLEALILTGTDVTDTINLV